VEFTRAQGFYGLLPPSLLFLAPHTSGPRDVPRCGALSLLQKTPHYRGDPAKFAARLYVKLWVLTDCVTACLTAPHLTPYYRPIRYSRRDSRVLVCDSVLRSLLPAALHASPLPRPCPRPRHDRTCLIHCSLFLFLISAATAGGKTTVQTVSEAAKTLPTTPTRER
jgi:hypothetical protein